ncbi:MAG: hypothetical protein ACUVXB_12590, partial [Bryobacteraceae bacterium]
TYSGLWELVRAMLPDGTEDLGGSLQTIAGQLEQIRPVAQQQAAALLDNTEAVTANTVTLVSTSTAAAVGEKAKSVAGTVLKGLTLSPLISGLVGLFGGDKKEEPPVVRYSSPKPIRLQTGLTGGGTTPIAEVAYDDDGQPRAAGSAAGLGPAYFGPPITIQVQAMDSRSFLNHSEEIARAVREALLNAHSLSEVISEL